MTTIHERQLTFGPVNHDLDNNINFSPDGRFLVFDCRGVGDIPSNRTLGIVEVLTGKTEYFYRTPEEQSGVGAASFLNNREVIAMHALSQDIRYDFTERAGRIIPINGNRGRWLDSRDVLAPFTPGALRGGTHKHEPDHSGAWVGFTYNDHFMKTHRGSDLRNVGVCRRGTVVKVPKYLGNIEGETFSVLLTECVAQPSPNSDQYSRADGDCWIGRDGYRTNTGKYQRARAFRGTVSKKIGVIVVVCTYLFKGRLMSCQ